MHCKIAFTTIIAFSFCLFSAIAHADDSSAARDAFAAAVRALNLQTKIPESVEKKKEEAARPAREWRGDGESIGGLAKVLMWLAIAVFAALVIMTIIDNFRFSKKFRDPERVKEAEISPQETQMRMDRAHDEAEALAADGDYAEAMHTLLLQSLAEMRRRLDMSIATSLTSREIYARVQLSEQSRQALDDIISRVEISYFGDHKPEREEYIACRESYVRLTALLGGRA